MEFNCFYGQTHLSIDTAKETEVSQILSGRRVVVEANEKRKQQEKKNTIFLFFFFNTKTNNKAN